MDDSISVDVAEPWVMQIHGFDRYIDGEIEPGFVYGFICVEVDGDTAKFKLVRLPI